MEGEKKGKKRKKKEEQELPLWKGCDLHGGCGRYIFLCYLWEDMGRYDVTYAVVYTSCVII